MGTAAGLVRWTRDGITEAGISALSNAPALSLARDSIGRLWDDSIVPALTEAVKAAKAEG